MAASPRWWRGLSLVCGWLLWLVGIYVVATPPEVQRGQAVAFADWENRDRPQDPPHVKWRSFHCTLLEDESFSAQGERAGWDVRTLRQRCAEGGAPFWSAWHVLQKAAHSTDGTTIASLSLPTSLVEQGMEEALPRLVQPVIRRMMWTYGAELRQHSRHWRLPNWLLAELELSRSSEILLDRPRVRVGRDTLSVEADVDIRLVFEFSSRPMIRARQRAPRRFSLTIGDRIQPLRLVFSVSESSEGAVVHVSEAGFQRQGCRISRIPLLSDIIDFNAFCDQVLDRFHDELEAILKQAVGRQVGDALRDLELASLVFDALSPGLQGLLDDAGLQRWWADLAPELQSLHLRRSRVSLAVSSAASWTDAVPPWAAVEELSVGEGELRVSSLLLMSLAQAVFERPASELVELARLAGDEAVSDQLSRLQRGIAASGLVREQAIEQGQSLDTAFALLGLEVDGDVWIQPRFWVEGPQRIGIGVEDLRVLRLRETEAGLAFTGWGAVSWTDRYEEGLHFMAWADEAPFLQVALQPFGYDAVDERTQTRLRAQLRLMRDALAQGPARAPLPLSLPTKPSLGVGEHSVEVLRVEGDAPSQTLGLRLRFAPE